jgi:hypothetical protein
MTKDQSAAQSRTSQAAIEHAAKLARMALERIAREKARQDHLDSPNEKDGE